MAGSIGLSLSQQLDSEGKPLAGGLLYFYASGTTTPQSAYQDTALTIAYSNPIELDAAGRVPAFYLADGAIKIRLTDSGGVTILAADNLLVIGPSSGAFSGSAVDATSVLATGDIKYRYGTGTVSGFVRGNGRTIGSATSGATERANSDAQSLFEYLWTNDANLSVSTGRGATANADWSSNKTITLPDFRGRVLACMDDAGNSAASRLTTAGSSVDGVTLGASGGAQNVVIGTANVPQLAVTITDPGHVHSSGSSGFWTVGGGTLAGGTTSTLSSVSTTASSTTGITATANTASANTALNNMPPAITCTVYIKL